MRAISFLYRDFLPPHNFPSVRINLYGVVLIDFYGFFQPPPLSRGKFNSRTLATFSFSLSFLLVSKNTRRFYFATGDPCFYASSFIRLFLLSIPASTRAKAERRNKWSGNYSLCESWRVVVGSGTEIRYDFISASRPRYAPRASFISFVRVGE